MTEKNFLKEITSTAKLYRGFTRKACIGELVKIFNIKCSFDDAGWFNVGKYKVVASVDGITEELTKADSWIAGFFSVLVNVNDIIAKGAKPVGYLGVISSKSPEIRRRIVEGIRDALEKYRLKILKIHTHPDSNYDSVDAAVVGLAKKVIPSSAAKPGDSLVLAVDLDGAYVEKGWVKCFDSVTNKSSEKIQKLIKGVISLTEKSIVNASRDISSPGIVGSIAMLCESSMVGVKLDVSRIPKPKDVGLNTWLTIYPSFSFIFSTKNPEKCSEVLRKVGYTVSVVGKVTKERKVVLTCGEDEEVFLNLEEESIFGVKKA